MKTLKIIWVTLIVFSLSACMYQSVTDNDWDKATRVCAEHRGVEKVKSHSLGHETVVCKDGSRDYLP